MKEIPDFDIERSQSVDYIMGSGLAKKAFEEPPFKNYANILKELIESIDRLADNCHMPEFTNHAMPHVCGMVKRASEWGENDGWLGAASPLEAACLLMALVIHDIGMLSRDSRDIPDSEREKYLKGLSEPSNWVRRTHVARIEKLVKSLLEDYMNEDQKLETYLNVIIGMAESHEKWPWDPGFVSREEDILQIGLNKERVAAFNGVIAVCDLLDEDYSRCDARTLLRHRHGTTENRAHWIRHGLTKSVERVSGHRTVVRMRRLDCQDLRMEMVYRTLRNHYRLVKLYNDVLKVIGGEVGQIEFCPGDGIPREEDGISKELEAYRDDPEFRYNLAPQLIATFLKEARNQDSGDSRMRQRLDEIGLETVDLSQMEEFFQPKRMWYPEERVIRGKGTIQERLEYARQIAEEAYANGEIEKLRHICGAVLNEISHQAVPLEQKYWALTYLLIYETGTMDFYEAQDKHHNALMPMACGKAPGKSDSPYQGLLDVVLCFLEPRISETFIEEYRDHLMKYDYSGLANDSATALLIRRAVGQFWFWDKEGDSWRQVSGHIRQTAGEGSLARGLKQQEKRLELQDRILYGKEEVTDQEFMEADQPAMAKAWYDFYQADWQKVWEDFQELVQLAEHNQDLFCAVQGFQNMTGRTIEWNGINVGDEFRKDGNGGIYRYQRRSGEQALSRFWKTRESCIETALAKNQINPRDTAGKRISVLRLISLRQLEALENWNLGEYLESVRNEARWTYDTAVYEDKNGHYQGYRGNLPDAVITLIQGMSSEEVSKEEKKELAAKMYRYFPDGFNKVAEYMVTNRQKCMWVYQVEWLEDLIGQFGGQHLSRVLEWLIQYNEFKGTQKAHLNLSEYKFLGQVAERFTEEDWRVIMPIGETLYNSYFLYNANKTFALTGLESMPLSDCEKMLDKISRWPSERQKRNTVYQICVALSQKRGAEINRKLHELVDLCRKTDPCQFYDELDNLIDIKNLLELKTIDIQGICQSAETTMETLKKADLFGYNSENFKDIEGRFTNQNWSLAPEEKVLSIIRDFCGFLKDYRGKMSKMYFSSICALLNRITGTGTERERREIAEFFVREYVRCREKIAIENTRLEYRDSPLNTFHMDFFGKETPERAVFSVLVNCIRDIPGQDRRDCVLWGIDAVASGYEQMYYYGMFLFTYYCLKGEGDLRQTALGGLLYIRGQLEAKDERFEGKLESVLQAWSGLEGLGEWFDGKGFKETARQDREYGELFLIPLRQIKERSVNPRLRNREV
ncbi:MAG: hypothetical protein HFG78_13255 [Hungatella sp.]|nr:hypothetical protein [Hungatella sp.]